MAEKPDGSTVLKPSEAQVKPPPMFKVVLFNDDYTPMDFVVVVLQIFFTLTREQATQIMLKVHRKAGASAGSIPRTWRRPKWNRSRRIRAQHQHPLQCVMEET